LCDTCKNCINNSLFEKHKCPEKNAVEAMMLLSQGAPNPKFGKKSSKKSVRRSRRSRKSVKRSRKAKKSVRKSRKTKKSVRKSRSRK